MEEILCSLHNYTKFSGNNISFYSLAQSGLDCGIDVIITTDRNIYPEGYSQYYYKSGKRLLILCGEELFDPIQKDSYHYLSLGIAKEQFNLQIRNPQNEIRILVDENMDNSAFRHFEMINAQRVLTSGISTEQKAIRNRLAAWDRFLQSKQHFVALAGSCTTPELKRFTYKEILATACNHLIIDEKLSGDYSHDNLLVLKAIKTGSLFLALDGLRDAKGFRFSGEGDNLSYTAYPGDTIYLKNSITFKISIPEPCVCRLICDGKTIKEWQQCKQVPYTIYEPGCYRVECSIIQKKESYDWIYTNPIYVVKG